MKKTVAILSALFVLISAVSAFAELDKTYKSTEVNADGSVRFRVNIPYALQYMKERSELIAKQIPTEKSKLKTKKLWEKFHHYTNAISIINKNPKIKKICVFGAFNSWITFSSDIPNILIPSSKNKDTWYTPTNSTITGVKKGDTILYKFVIDLGVSYVDGLGKPQEYIYVEDPLNADITDDGFDGYNSKLKY